MQRGSAATRQSLYKKLCQEVIHSYDEESKGRSRRSIPKIVNSIYPSYLSTLPSSSTSGSHPSLGIKLGRNLEEITSMLPVCKGAKEVCPMGNWTRLKFAGEAYSAVRGEMGEFKGESVL